MVDLWLLTVLQVRVRQDVVCWRGVQQLLGTTAGQAILTAVGGADSFGWGPETPNFPTEGTPRGAGFLTNSTARDHGVVLTRTKMVVSIKTDVTTCIWYCSCFRFAAQLPLLTLYAFSLLLFFFLFFQVYLAVFNPFSLDLSPHTLPSLWTLWYVRDSRLHLPDSHWDSETQHTLMHSHSQCCFEIIHRSKNKHPSMCHFR